MAHHATLSADDRFGETLTRLDKLVGGARRSRISADDLAAEIETLAGECGGEMLFALPADHPKLGKCQWAVLRYPQGRHERYVHVFYGARRGKYRIGEEEDAPAELARFARAWANVLIGCIGALGTLQGSISTAG
jgi:hypothetical protein